MKRTELKRGKPPVRKTRLKSGAPPRATGRPSQRFAKRRDPEYCAWIRTLPCLLNGRYDADSIMGKPCSPRVECAHVKSRGAAGDDRGNTVPLCGRHHRKQHSDGIETFQWWHDLDLAAIAAQLEARWVLRDFGGIA